MLSMIMGLGLNGEDFVPIKKLLAHFEILAR